MRVLCVHHEAPLRGGIYDAVIPAAGHEVVRWAPFAGEPAPEPSDVDAIVVFGGAVHPDADGTEPWLAAEVTFIRRALDEQVPVLGLCLGAQLIARAKGAWVGPAQASEVGWYRVEPNEVGLADPVVGVLAGPVDAFQWHHYTYAIPADATELARSARATQAFRLGDRAWGVQFHPEVTRELVHEWSGLAPEQVDGDVETLRAETDERIAEWNETGRRLCLAFLGQAARGSDLGQIFWSDPLAS
jgi:GMP synthase (glutamine-hydrolysing)